MTATNMCSHFGDFRCRPSFIAKFSTLRKGKKVMVYKVVKRFMVFHLQSSLMLVPYSSQHTQYLLFLFLESSRNQLQPPIRISSPLVLVPYSSQYIPYFLFLLLESSRNQLQPPIRTSPPRGDDT